MSILGQIEFCQLEDNVYHAKYRLEGLSKLHVQIREMSPPDFERLNLVVTECIHEANADLERHRRRLSPAQPSRHLPSKRMSAKGPSKSN